MPVFTICSQSRIDIINHLSSELVFLILFILSLEVFTARFNRDDLNDSYTGDYLLSRLLESICYFNYNRIKEPILIQVQITVLIENPKMQGL